MVESPEVVIENGINRFYLLASSQSWYIWENISNINQRYWDGLYLSPFTDKCYRFIHEQIYTV